jgi:site-specific DNA-methyltransferase (adenine-specific)
VDAIITDPPYPREYLHLYGQLAELAKSALKPDGVVAVMCGQSFLPEIMALMTPHLEYRWTMAYLTPGGQSVQVFPRKVNTFWKPVVVFGSARDWIGDVVKSDVNDNDKRFHHWGQSESGMADLVERLTLPGDLVCDPFLGAGTTAVVCKALGRRFVGCDVDAEHVASALDRIKEAVCPK